MSEKLEKAILRIKSAAEMAENMGNTLILAYSGGKDSDLLLDIVMKSDVKFKAEHNHTTADAPETVYHIREVFAGLRKRGIEADINYPEEIEIDGKRIRASMWNLIIKKKFPPTRMVRYCCEYFKERCFDGQHIMTGVRWAESLNRKNKRGLHEKLGTRPENKIIYFDENDDKHKLMEICQLKSRIITNPIIDWTDADVWYYIKEHGIKTNILYGFGFRRVGCIGCPLPGGKVQQFELQMYPKYEAAYIRTFNRMIESLRKLGCEINDNWKDGKAVLDWWTEKINSGDVEEMEQLNLFDEK
jgi:phosphoadenosine phosphosulfate reductase